MAIVIAAPASGSGKTTVTLALLAALRRQGLAIQSFKVGPDYLDPQFHERATGRPCRNLDPILTSEDYVRRCFAFHSQGQAGAVIEGVMGLFDGQGGTDRGSTAAVSRLLAVPVVLVIDAARMAATVGAIATGLANFDPRVQVAGVILNRVGSPRHEEILRAALAPLGLPVLGCFPRQTGLEMPSRHLGLVPVGEQPQITNLLDQLAQLAQASCDWERLLPLIRARPAGGAIAHLWPDCQPLPKPVRLAIAQDACFHFYYPDNLDLLRHLGATLIPFSPLTAGLPNQIDGLPLDGLYLGGGFPELAAAPLAQALRPVYPPPTPIPPIYAECGGLMILGQHLTTFDQQTWPMAGLLPYDVAMTPTLTLGYRQATVRQDTILLPQGATVCGHEFHRSQATPCPPAPLYHFAPPQPDQGPIWEGWGSPNIHASYLHLHWGATPQWPQRWLQQLEAGSAS